VAAMTPRSRRGGSLRCGWPRLGLWGAVLLGSVAHAGPMVDPEAEPSDTSDITDSSDTVDGPESSDVPRPSAAEAARQRIAVLEWSRAPAVQLVAELPGATVAERVAVARALGRLRDPGAAEPLADLVRAEEPEVRLHAASALGWTPHTAPLIRELLDEISVTPRGLGVARLEEQLAARLVRGLGHQGTSRDVARLRRLVHESAPVGLAAAHALGRMAIREVPAVQEAVPALAMALSSAEPHRAQAAAFALNRIGLDGTASEAVVAQVVRGVRHGATSSTRAWCLRAVWPALGAEERIDLFSEAVVSSRRVVRVAAFDVLQLGDFDATIVGAFTRDPDPWVRRASLSALGRLGGSADALRAIAEEPDPWHAAHAVRALGLGDEAVATDPEAPVPLRAAHAELLSDPELLLSLAREAPPPVQSAAALALMRAESVPDTVLDALHTADDPLLREVAVEVLVASEPRGLETMLVRWGTEASHPEVAAACAEALLDRHEANPRSLRGVSVESLVGALAAATLPRAQQAAAALAEAGRVALPERAERGLPERFGPPPEHDAHAWPGGLGELGWPAVSAAQQVLGAVVHTDHGDLVIELEPEVAPLAVAAFTTLAEAGFYDGLPMHRVVPGFVVQGGDPRGDGWGGPGWSLPDEVSAESFDAGAVGMARGGPDSGGSQWFVTTTDQPHLVGLYTRFGHVVDGLYLAQRMPAGAVVQGIVIERAPDDG